MKFRRTSSIACGLCLFWVAASAHAQVLRTPAGAFPISSSVVTPADARVIYVSGTTAAAGPGAPVTGDTTAQTVSTLKRIQGVLQAQGFDLGDVVMMRVFLVADPAKGTAMDFAGMMAGYTQFFGTAAQPNKPARTTVQVAGLAATGALVEIEVQAVKPVQH